MNRGRRRTVFLGDSAVHAPAATGAAQWVDRNGERFFRIANYHAMPPFLLSVVSAYDHWMFVSSTGGLTCGRRSPENALFPYVTDDKIHDAWATTGPLTLFLVEREGRLRLWQPFDPTCPVYDLERNLYKNVPGNQLMFEEVNHELGLLFSYVWTTGRRFGFVRRSRLLNTGATEVRVRLLDGLRNLLPYGVDRAAQAELSTLVDAYKQAESASGICAGIYTLSSILTDRPEPSEALKATVVSSTGLAPARVLLSEDQVPAFRRADDVHPEARIKGKRGAFFVESAVVLPANASRKWYVLADVECGPSGTAALLHAIRRGITEDELERDVADGTARLERLVGGADGFQRSADDLVAARHFSNTLFNIMRGGTFPYEYGFPVEDFLCFGRERNVPVSGVVESALRALDGPLTLESAERLAEDEPSGTFARLVREYLPLTFSRRHGDPSRPWNHFSITIRNGNGTEYLHYEGNWRDIFQNWEALAISFPGYIESFIAKFVNASTPDGHNAYRISRAGIDWETLAPDHPWSNIGYWGDHQVGYLCRLLEHSRAYHPGMLGRWLTRDVFVYAEVPYRIKTYPEMLRDPKNTVEYDDDRARTIADRVAQIGADGKLVTIADGPIYRVGLLEKLLVSALAKIGNLVPGGGIWMNTQRPEWNDANNALVGYGLSMVTACHLRRYLRVLGALLRDDTTTSYEVSEELVDLFRDAGAVLRDHAGLLDGPVDGTGRKSFMDRMGTAVDSYRARVYRGFRGDRGPLGKGEIEQFLATAVAFLDHSIAHSRRPDGLYHSYNIIRFDDRGYDVESLDVMLEGQVAALDSGFLDSEAALTLLDALRGSPLYREDQHSYLLYPNRETASFLDKNVIPPSAVEDSAWIRHQLESERPDYVERDVEGRVHFNGAFRNANELRAALDRDPTVDARDAADLCGVFEAVFRHRTFTGRSGSMYKYEGLGCIYWHMVSKLLLATVEVIDEAVRSDADRTVIDRLAARFEDIRAGLGVHKPPARYGAFPTDAYSHTPEFGGVQQPGLTGQVKEDVIIRFRQLGVRVSSGEIAFEPVLLERDEFLREPSSWSYSVGGPKSTEELPARSLAFTICGVPVVYCLGESARVRVFLQNGPPIVLPGTRLGAELSRSLFGREQRIRKLVVDVPETALRQRA